MTHEFSNRSRNSVPHILSPRTRREFLLNAGAGFGGLALSALLAEEAQASARVEAGGPKLPPFAAKARSVIWLFMEGGPSHIDLFDPKPELERLGATTLYTTETRELFGRDIEVPITGLSAATQNIILLRHVEHRATMLRVMAILKVRDDAYDARMRELQITDHGLMLRDTFAAESRVATGGGFSSDPRISSKE